MTFHNSFTVVKRTTNGTVVVFRVLSMEIFLEDNIRDGHFQCVTCLVRTFAYVCNPKENQSGKRGENFYRQVNTSWQIWLKKVVKIREQSCFCWTIWGLMTFKCAIWSVYNRCAIAIILRNVESLSLSITLHPYRICMILVCHMWDVSKSKGPSQE